ncbi:hypothetical protein CBL_03164 [Carabus blaptoides fortunei]
MVVASSVVTAHTTTTTDCLNWGAISMQMNVSEWRLVGNGLYDGRPAINPQNMLRDVADEASKSGGRTTFPEVQQTIANTSLPSQPSTLSPAISWQNAALCRTTPAPNTVLVAPKKTINLSGYSPIAEQSRLQGAAMSAQADLQLVIWSSRILTPDILIVSS